jgi:hypothetical protein
MLRSEHVQLALAIGGDLLLMHPANWAGPPFIKVVERVSVFGPHYAVVDPSKDSLDLNLRNPKSSPYVFDVALEQFANHQHIQLPHHAVRKTVTSTPNPVAFTQPTFGSWCSDCRHALAPA